ncbi:class I SAM-dependent methyltransferase [Streptomyces sp. bgisy031]|uniref:class I SAM-dependent methyltransferase n=1 Tax=Streptomyces sp. bgisy031 TaxID=3413772 RepID=UPI003D74A23B
MVRAHSIDRPADLDVISESYDRVADNYAHMVVTTGVGDIRRHSWLKASIDAFADRVRRIGPVLDVGCGSGTVTAYLAERGLDVSGVDLSPLVIENARRLIRDAASVSPLPPTSALKKRPWAAYPGGGDCSTFLATSFLRSWPCSRAP